MTADVLVVGGGPVGLTLAHRLGQAGVDTLVVERERDVYPLPRAIHLDGDAVRLLRRIGVWGALAPEHTARAEAMRFLDARRRVLVELRAGDDPAIAHGTLFWQPALECALRDGLQRWPSVRLVTGATVARLDRRGDGVVAVVVSDGGPSRVDARWGVGCDGARSMVRDALGTSMDRLGRPRRWLVVDALAARPEALASPTSRLPAVAEQVCDPARPATYVPGAGRHRRWEFMLADDEPVPDAATLARWLRPWADARHLDVRRAAPYHARAVVARRWRSGRLVLAGDAAHEMPPFLGQGLASGLRDADALAWRLARIVRGTAAADVLDDYAAERRAHVRAVVRRTLLAGALVQTRLAAVASLRDAALTVAGRLAGGALAFVPEVPPLRGPHVGRGRRAGRLVPDAPLVTLDGLARVDDLLGADFVGLARHRTSADPRVLRVLPSGAPPEHGAVVDASGVLRAWMGRERLVWLRPDGIALGASVAPP